MVLAPPKVEIKLEPLKQFQKEISNKSIMKHPAVQAMLKQWAARYISFIRERFDIYSKGGGDWKPLAPSTLMARARKGKSGKSKKKKLALKKIAAKMKSARNKGQWSYQYDQLLKSVNASILRDTGTLYATLSPSLNKPGQIAETTEFGVRVGFGGGAPSADGKTPLVTIMAAHQFGVPGRLPARPILVEPDQRTLNAMATDTERALIKLAKDTKN